MKAIRPDQSNAKLYARRKSFFIKTSGKKPISLSKCALQPWSGWPVLTFGKRLKFQRTDPRKTNDSFATVASWDQILIRTFPKKLLHSFTKDATQSHRVVNSKERGLILTNLSLFYTWSAVAKECNTVAQLMSGNARNSQSAESGKTSPKGLRKFK